MLKKYTKIVICAATISASTLMAKSFVTQSNNQKGDFLIAPLFMAQQNICSTIKVVNTNQYSSILAKFTIRESVASHEVDGPIMLSPGDVWEAKICNIDGQVVLTSNDDSNHPSAKQMMIKGINLFSHSFSTNNKQENRNLDFTKGYVEIYPIAQFDEHSRQKVSKKVLLERWEQLIQGNTKIAKLRKDGVDEDSLTGVISFSTLGQETASIPMLAFKNVHNYQRTGDKIYFTNDSNPNLLIGKENKNKILALLQKKQTSFTYDKCGIDQYLFITFPFSYKQNQSRRYKLVIRDNCENKFEMVDIEIQYRSKVKKQWESISGKVWKDDNKNGIQDSNEMGIKDIKVMCPSFVSDCLETLEEIAIRGRESFIRAGGQSLTLIPCLNEHPEWITFLVDNIQAFAKK